MNTTKKIMVSNAMEYHTAITNTHYNKRDESHKYNTEKKKLDP